MNASTVRWRRRLLAIASIAPTALALAASAPLTHCTGSSCSILASSYDQSCAHDSDCVAVYSGTTCHACACENAAINVSAQGRYDSDRSGVEVGECPCPSPPAVGCVSGTCVVTGGIAVGDAGVDAGVDAGKD
jgi:hypothetical protein